MCEKCQEIKEHISVIEEHLGMINQILGSEGEAENYENAPQEEGGQPRSLAIIMEARKKSEPPQ